MDIITIDFETYWATDYSLSMMTPLEYVMGDRFQVISCSIKVNAGTTVVLFGQEAIAVYFDTLDVANSALLAHNNSGFDAYIASYIFGLKPKLWLCTLAMARPIHAKVAGGSLAKLVLHYGLGVKNNAVLLATKGKYLEDFTAQEIADMRRYNGEDTDQCYELFKILRKETHPSELWQIDNTIRMRTEPQFELDSGMLTTALSMERDHKFKSLLDLAKLLRAAAGPGDDVAAVAARLDGEELELPYGDEAAMTEWVRERLASAPKFSALLASRGVEVPMKRSPSDPDSGKMVPALAKSDQEFIDLQEHDDPIVAAAARARLVEKSTLLETRIQKFLTAGALASGMLPVPIRPYGADTTWRDSGEEYNMLNLPRVNPKKPRPQDALRCSLRAPKGKKVMVADQSNIELRVNHTLWKVKSSMDLWKANPDADLYRAGAAMTYGIKPEDVTKDQRQLDKIKQLGLGFGAGAQTFRLVAKTMGGLDLSPVTRVLSGAETRALQQYENDLVYNKDGFAVVTESDPAQEAVDDWRERYAPIVTGWRTCHNALKHIRAGQEVDIDPWGLATTCKEGIRLNTGRNHIIRYPDLREEFNGDTGKTEWVYGHGRNKARIYAGKITENCLAEGTLVLTDRGYVPIEEVGGSDRVHDGVEFVRHAGTVFKSVQECVSVDGVSMTPDHEVLTNGGWKAASQEPEPYRPDLRHVVGDIPGTQRWEEAVLAIPVSVRPPVREGGQRRDEGGQARGDAELWMRERKAGRGEEQDARYDETPSLRGVALDDRPVSPANAQGLGELRGTGDHRGPRVGSILRGVLAGHGSELPAGADLGEAGQRPGLLAEQLSLGNAPRADDEHSAQRARARHPSVVGLVRHQQVDAVLPGEAGTSAHRVYDILDAGPRHRFVVLGASGPFIVHNCVQALARDTICDNTLSFYKSTGVRAAMRPYDEIVSVVPEENAVELLAELQRIMRTPPKWWPELTVWSEGDIADTYGAAK